MASASLSAYAWLWQNEVLSDVTLHLCTEQPTSEPFCANSSSCLTRKSTAAASGGCSKAAKTSEDVGCSAAADADVESHARTFRCHASVLASASAYFKASIVRWSSSHSSSATKADKADSTSSGEDGMAAVSGIVLVVNIDEEQVDAMEAMLQHC